MLTYAAIKMSGLPEGRVIGSGTVLDSARLQEALGAHLGVDPRDVEAYVIGEHGDSELAVWSSADVAGVPLKDFCEMRGHFDHEEAERRIAEDAKNAAYEIIRPQARHVLRHRHEREAPVHRHHARREVHPAHLLRSWWANMAFRISRSPCPQLWARGGVECRVPISLDEEELAELHASAKALRDVIDNIEVEL